MCADQFNSCAAGTALVLPLSSTQGLCSHRPKFPPGGISFDRQWANTNFYLCGFQVALAGKVYWSFILPETAAKPNNHFLLAQLRNFKCAVLQNSMRTLSLLPLLSSLACINISCYTHWAVMRLGNTSAVKATLSAWKGKRVLPFTFPCSQLMPLRSQQL